MTERNRIAISIRTFGLAAAYTVTSIRNELSPTSISQIGPAASLRLCIRACTVRHHSTHTRWYSYRETEKARMAFNVYPLVGRRVRERERERCCVCAHYRPVFVHCLLLQRARDARSKSRAVTWSFTCCIQTGRVSTYTELKQPAFVHSCRSHGIFCTSSDARCLFAAYLTIH